MPSLTAVNRRGNRVINFPSKTAVNNEDWAHCKSSGEESTL